MTNQSLTYKDKLQTLRIVMGGRGMDGFIVPRADEYQGEFLASCAERLPWLTGFTGSGGAAVILKDEAVVLTDGRYTIQVDQQVDAALYGTGDITKLPVSRWLAEHCVRGEVIGYDSWLHTPKQIEDIEKALEGKSVELRAAALNPVDEIWEGQPGQPGSEARIFPEALAGASSEGKRQAIVEKLERGGIYACVLSLPDSIAWLLNVRGGDVDYIPLILSYAIIDRLGGVQWFVEESRIPDEVRTALGADVQIAPPSRIAEHIEALAGSAKEAGLKLGVDYSRSPVWFKAQLENAGAEVADFKDPCLDPKSLKTGAEQEAIRRSHILDGAALVKFLHWLDMEAPKGSLTELDMDEKLQEFRGQTPDYRGPSFPTIAGFGSNGAIVHYRATKENNAPITPPGLLLVDSGGQYSGRDLAGTTDITRTVAIGDIDADARDSFTRVLKGHIAVAAAEFLQGTSGIDIDALARRPLQEAGLDYAHGTGHGVGCYLAVHEEAAGLSPKGKNALCAGMLLSNEPGYYKEGEYGIRIENLMLVKEAGAGKLGFETVSLAPIDRQAINDRLLEPHEIEWLNDYHRLVWEKLSELLEGDVRDWLEAQTRVL